MLDDQVDIGAIPHASVISVNGSAWKMRTSYHILEM